MKLIDFIHRTPCPAPWSEGDNIPWNEPGFSERMLAEHLSQDHALASRQLDRIRTQVEWILTTPLKGTKARVLDLGCGPGLYTAELAARDCTCHGIDYSPASIRHAQTAATASGQACTYELGDLRECAFGTGYDLAMLIYGQLNVFRRDQALSILRRVCTALKPGGKLLLEVQSPDHIRSGGQAAPSWYSCPSGLFSEKPHVVLQENFWVEEAKASVNRFTVIDAATADLTSWSLTNEAYTREELTQHLQAAGFGAVEWHPSLTGAKEEGQPDLPVVVASR